MTTHREIHLPSWAGFRATRRPRRDLEPPWQQSDGTAMLFIDDPPSPEQQAGLQFLLDHEEDMAEIVLQAVWNAYAWLLEHPPESIDDEDLDELLPDLEDQEELRALIGLASVHVLRVARDGRACVGFAFGCTWDEHGIGVLTYEGWILWIGDAATACDERIAAERC